MSFSFLFLVLLVPNLFKAKIIKLPFPKEKGEKYSMFPEQLYLAMPFTSREYILKVVAVN